MAILLRKNSLESIAMAEAKGQKISDQDGASEAIKIDLYRRSEQFSEALVLCKSMGETDCDDVMRKIINFQISLIHKKDTSAHTVSEALDVK